MAKPTLSEISKLFKTDDKPTDFHYYGTIVSADTENRTYEVSINRDENITVEAARLVGAHVGDTVMVTVMANGYATVTGRVGGDTDATDAQRAADSAASVADSARTTATNALNSATQASGIAAEAKTKAEHAIGLAEEAEAEAGRARDAANESERQADLSRQAAQASAQQAELSRQAADLSAQNALGSKISADAAQDAAEAAQDAAEDAQSASESARDRAISAEGYAQQANTHATQAETYAGQALSSAETANTAANSAITQLGVVQDVVGVLDWVSTHATYKASSDTSVVAGKMYFTKSGNTYTLVVNPTGNPSTQGYYEIDSIDEAVTNYVASHLALTNDGLWVTKDNNGYKILVSNTGVKIYDPQGILVSTFGESISFSSTRPQKIGNNNQYIEYYNDNGTYKVRIVADSITLGGSNVATTLSNLAAADTDQTNALNAYKTSNDAAVAANATGLANYIASNNSVIESLERQIDGAIDTWYYSGVPTLNNDPAKNWPVNTYESHERDLYFDTSTGHTYRFARTGNTEPYTYEWIEIQDADALRALQAAAAAQDTADNKRRVFTVSSNDHPVPPYDVGDLWVQGQNGDILRCVQTRLDPQVWASTDWQPASKYTDDSAVTALAGNVYTKSEVYTKQNIDTKIGEINTTITSKETTIKQYADTKASAAETAAKTYADNNFDSKGSAASALDDAKDYADDNFDSKGSASAAQAAAISAAAADATSKANNAKDAAISSAATDATTKANNAKNAAISAAATDATNKANAAKADAISTASTDATNKANAAKQAAINDAASKYYNKTETYTKSEIEQKAGEISLSVAQEEVKKVISVKEASGNIVHIEDASEYPALSLKVNIAPKQDLHGYDKPWSGGAGKNLADSNYPSAYTANQYNLFFGILKTGTYTLSTNRKDVAIYVRKSEVPIYGGDYIGVSYNGNPCKFTVDENGWYFAHAYRSGTTPSWADEPITEVQLEVGSMATSYEPYENICPISGWESVETYDTGVNVWDEEWELGALSATGGNATSSTEIRSKNYIPVIGGQTYYLHCAVPSTFNYKFYDADKNFISDSYIGRNNTLTIPNDVRYMRFFMGAAYGTTYNNDISINYPSTDHDYHAYTGTTYTTNLPETVYGGTLDVVNGVLTVDRAMVDMGTLNWRANGAIPNGNQYAVGITDKAVGETNFICSSYMTGTPQVTIGYICGRASNTTIACNALESTANDFIASVSGQQLVYELAEPRTIQLTPKQVTTLLGTNNVWADSGDVYLKYATMNPDMQALMNKSNDDLSRAKAEIKVTTDAIESTVSNKVGNNEVISKINQSAESIQIQANKVEIDGTVTFNAIKSQTDEAYDAKNSAATAESNAKTYADGKASTAETNAKTYADGKASTAESNAKTYADGKASTAESNAKTYADGKASTAESNAKTYADGKASTAESNAKSYADGKASTAEQNAKAYVDANYVANTAALSRTQRIYYRSDSSTLPSPPTENNKGKWFVPTQSDTGYNTWSKDIVPLIGGFSYLFMCDQTQTAAQYVAGNECTNSSVMRDDSTTVIDGGSITTGKINANYIDAAGLQIGTGQVDGLGDFMSLMTFQNGVLRIAKPGSRFAVELSDDGLFFKQNETAVSYINMNRLYIPYAVVLDQMMVGKEENNSLWAWTSEEDGSLTLKWVGGNN